MKFDVDLSGVINALDSDYETLKENTRPAAQAMAKIFYDNARDNVMRLNSITGNLLNSIYQKFDDDSLIEGVSRYVVSWRTSGSGLAKAPHGHLIEFGYQQAYARYFKNGQWYTDKRQKLAQPRVVPAYPFMRPAYEQGLSEAERTGVEILLKGVAE